LLTRCHFDLVKIDKTLVAQITADEPPPGWMGGLAALLRTTSLQIIAEGVETEYQVGALRAAGVQMAQGHFFAPPLSAADFKTHYSATKVARGYTV
jgi:EAL domain-containing protein (putative c-di-GMP-specific phosphodiesterase class I)